MQTVTEKLWTQSYTFKNSKFQVFIKQVTTSNEVTEFLHQFFDQKASHICYAYVLGVITSKFNDNNEPNKVAGFAILIILLAQELTNIIVLVRRYFQPPKLGVATLMRAYQYGLLNYLKTTTLLTIVPSKKYAFLILKQEKNSLKLTFFINLSNKTPISFYHPEIKITFIADSFLLC